MFTPLFQVVAYFCKPTPLGLLCIADALSLEEYVLKVSSSPGNSCPSPAVVCKSWHYENVVVGPGFVVFVSVGTAVSGEPETGEELVLVPAGGTEDDM